MCTRWNVRWPGFHPPYPFSIFSWCLTDVCFVFCYFCCRFKVLQSHKNLMEKLNTKQQLHHKNLQSCCRTCGNSTEELISIFDDEGLGYELDIKISTYLNLQVCLFCSKNDRTLTQRDINVLTDLKSEERVDESKRILFLYLGERVRPTSIEHLHWVHNNVTIVP